MRGLGGIYKRGPVYWIRYHHRGREYRESARSTERGDAVRLLKQRVADLAQGRPSPADEERVTFDQIATDYIGERTLKNVPKPRLQWSLARVAHLKTFFGGMRAVEITTATMREYAKVRRASGAEPGTVNRDFGVLSRMFTLAIQAGRFSRRPYIPRLPENPPRQGFMEHADYLAIRAHLPAHFRDVLDFGYLSGWRRGEILTLEWRDVDREAGVIRLRPEVSKTREGRVLVLSGPLREVIERRWRDRALGCPLVFHHASRSLDGFKNAWVRACKAAGLPGKLFHDLRRTAVRNMVRAGIPERVAMQVSGHKTRSIFDRYNIVSEADLRSAADRLAAYVQANGAS
ncbi:MAG: tyrosine-type recombinase/integrase [Candidatus Rokubacteria bacterium]|nr:tyrosine-type recombinase/integrase [Candidatus Rokubacteria bacterium]